MRHRLVFLLLLPLAMPAWAWADDPPEELPPPQPQKSVLVNRDPVQSSPYAAGWSLVGPRGRHYCVGEVALADYLHLGHRQIVALKAEEPASTTPRDESFLYFRETLAGHRWAIARYPSPDRRYRVYFQAADSSGQWRLFQRADATWEPQPAEEPTFVILPEVSCDVWLLSETFFLWP